MTDDSAAWVRFAIIDPKTLSAPNQEKHFLLIYEVVDDYVAKRSPYRAEHLALAERAANRDELVLGGALAEPVDNAILLFRSKDAKVAESFALADPYVKNGLVTKWTVREWTTVAGFALKR